VEFSKLQADALTLIELLRTRRGDLEHFDDEIKKLGGNVYSVNRLQGIVRSIQANFQQGLFDSLLVQLESEIASNYFAQAEELLNERVAGA
jgi:hypothetical protein